MKGLRMNLRPVKGISLAPKAKSIALITGSNGFIGQHLARELACSGMEIAGVDRCLAPAGAALLVDLLDPVATRRTIKEIRPNYIFHMAGLIHANSLEELYRGNVEPTVNLLQAVKESGCGSRVVIPGSAAEYGKVTVSDLPLTEERLPNPVSLYGVAKAWQTTVARYYAIQGLDVLIGRIFNVIGRGVPETLSIGAFAGQLKKIAKGDIPPQIAVGNLQPKRDFIDVSDACRGLLAVAEKGRSGEIYNICSGSSLSMGNILRMMIDYSGMDVQVEVDQARIKGGDVDDIFGSYDKLATETGWYPAVTIGDSLARIMG